MSEQGKLVFLPGWGFKASIFEQTAQHFSNTQLLDLPRLKEAQSEDSIADILKILIPKNAVVIAWSLSTLLVLCLLKKYPDHIQKLIALHGSPCFSAKSDWPGIAAVNQMLFKKLYDKKSFLKKIFYSDILFPSAAPELFDTLEHYQSQDFNSWHYYLNLLFDCDLRQTLLNVGHKVHFILGEEDKIVPAEIRELLPEQVKVTSLVDTGHASFLTKPNNFLNSLQLYLHHEYDSQ